MYYGGTHYNYRSGVLRRYVVEGSKLAPSFSLKPTYPNSSKIVGKAALLTYGSKLGPKSQ
jgi:hypothetical protein